MNACTDRKERYTLRSGTARLHVCNVILNSGQQSTCEPPRKANLEKAAISLDIGALLLAHELLVDFEVTHCGCSSHRNCDAPVLRQLAYLERSKMGKKSKRRHFT